MHAGEVKGALQRLQACMPQGMAPPSLASLAVEIVCDWASASQMPQLSLTGDPCSASGC
jgi:hypothetical protein